MVFLPWRSSQTSVNTQQPPDYQGFSRLASAHHRGARVFLGVTSLAASGIAPCFAAPVLEGPVLGSAYRLYLTVDHLWTFPVHQDDILLVTTPVLDLPQGAQLGQILI